MPKLLLVLATARLITQDLLGQVNGLHASVVVLQLQSISWVGVVGMVSANGITPGSAEALRISLEGSTPNGSVVVGNNRHDAVMIMIVMSFRGWL